MLLLLTLGGGLALLANSTATLPVPPLLRDVALVVAVALIAGGAVAAARVVSHLRASRQRFGFNRTTLSLWIADVVKGALIGAALACRC